MIGRLEVICGSMFAGKSEELMRRLRRDKIAGRRVVLIKPSIDDRYEVDAVVSHNGAKMDAVEAKDASEVVDIGVGFEVIGIDEVQFYDEFFIVNAIKMLVQGRKKVIVSGLDMTFRQEPFAAMPELLAIAESVTKLSAICHRCGADAYFTQRLVDGKPASFSGDTVVIGGRDSYEARCRLCFESKQ